MNRDSFVFYASFYEAIKELPRDVQGEIYTAIMEYSLYGKETDSLKQIAKAVFTLIKPQLDANNKRYESGKKGGRPPREINQDQTKDKPNHNQEETKSKPNVNDNVNDNVNKKENIKEKPIRFSPPTIEEVESYCLERQNEVDASRFFNFYKSKGWMVGKNKMKDWKAAVRTWEKEEKQKGGKNAADRSYNKPSQRGAMCGIKE